MMERCSTFTWQNSELKLQTSDDGYFIQNAEQQADGLFPPHCITIYLKTLQIVVKVLSIKSFYDENNYCKPLAKTTVKIYNRLLNTKSPPAI